MVNLKAPQLEHTPWPTPSRAIYGFILYVATYVLYGAYLIWAFFPDSWLHAVGLTYLPARHWVITFPLLCCTLVGIVFVSYASNIWWNSYEFEDEFESEKNKPNDVIQRDAANVSADMAECPEVAVEENGANALLSTCDNHDGTTSVASAILTDNQVAEFCENNQSEKTASSQLLSSSNAFVATQQPTVNTPSIVKPCLQNALQPAKTGKKPVKYSMILRSRKKQTEFQ